MTVRDVFLEHVIPALGGLIGVLMFASPLKAVLRVRKEKNLGDLNPMPYPAILANCAGWIGYGWTVDNIYVYVPNEIGFLLGLFFTLSCYGLLDSKSRDRQMAIMVLFSIVLTVVGAIGALGELSQNARKLLWGFTCNAILLVYYSAPLSTVYNVIRSRNAASLHWPLSLASMINGALWTAYGIAVTDYFIWVPNGIGAILAGFTLLLIWIFPGRPIKSRNSPASSESDPPSSTSQHPLVNGLVLAGAAGEGKVKEPPETQWSELRDSEASDVNLRPADDLA